MCWRSPVGQEEGADVRHRRRGGTQFGQSHDVLEGDLCLRAHVHQLDVLRWPLTPGPRGPPEHLHHDGVFSAA